MAALESVALARNGVRAGALADGVRGDGRAARHRDRLGLLPPGTRLPAERELCAKLGIARSTLRQALVALGQSGHLHATRGRGGGTFVADPQPPAGPPRRSYSRTGTMCCDERMAVEVGAAVLAAERAEPEMLERARRAHRRPRRDARDFPAYRQADIRLHVGLAEAAHSPRLVTAMTEVQGAMTRSDHAYRPSARGARLLERPASPRARGRAPPRRGGRGARDGRAPRGTEHVLAGLLPRAGALQLDCPLHESAPVGVLPRARGLVELRSTASPVGIRSAISSVELHTRPRRRRAPQRRRRSRRRRRAGPSHRRVGLKLEQCWIACQAAIDAQHIDRDSSRITLTTSATRHAIASNAARARCAGRAPAVRPPITARASGLHHGAPTPDSAGSTRTPPASSTAAAAAASASGIGCEPKIPAQPLEQRSSRENAAVDRPFDPAGRPATRSSVRGLRRARAARCRRARARTRRFRRSL